MIEIETKAETKSTKTLVTKMEKKKATLEQFHAFMLLPNELILKLMHYFGSRENIILAMLHPRLLDLCKSDARLKLWNQLQIDNDICNSETIDVVASNFIKPYTCSLEISTNMNGSNRALTASIPPSFFERISAFTSCLSSLKLVGQKFDSKFPNLFKILPSTLKQLDLTGTFIDVSKYHNIPSERQHIYIEQSYSYFQGISNLPQLEELRLDSCIWLLPFDLLYIRGLLNLKRLSLAGCRLSEHNDRFMGNGVHVKEPIAIKRVNWRRIFSALQFGLLVLEELDITNSDISRNGIITSLFFASTRFDTSPIRILKLAYHDMDYVWPLMGSCITLSLLSRCVNLELLDVSGFNLEPTSGIRMTCAIQFSLHFTRVLHFTKLRKIYYHFCGIPMWENLPSPGRKETSPDRNHSPVEAKKVRI